MTTATLARPAPTTLGPAAPRPLTGRDDELRAVAEILRRARPPFGVVLAGRPGVGRTRLAREAVTLASAHRGAPVWVGATASARAVPFGALWPLLDVVGLGGAGHAGPGLPARVADAVPAGTVLGLDDAHLLDDSSAALVHELVLRRAVTAVLTLRAGEPAPDAVTALWKDGHLDRLEVAPMSVEQAGAMVEGVLGGPVSGHSLRRLVALSGGSLVLLRQLLADEVSAGRLGPTAGVWQWRDAPVFSERLAELVEAQVGRLPADLARGCELLALGGAVDVDVLARLVGAETVEAVERHGAVGVCDDGGRLVARLAHPLHAAVLRSRVPKVRARRLRGELAAAQAGAGTDDPVRRALLALDAGIAPPPGVVVPAIGRAVARLDLDLAERLLRAVPETESTDLIRAYLAGWRDEGGRAERHLVGPADAAAGDDRRAAVAVTRAHITHCVLGRPEQAEQLLVTAWDAIVEPAARHELVAVRALHTVLLGPPRRGGGGSSGRARGAGGGGAGSGLGRAGGGHGPGPGRAIRPARRRGRPGVPRGVAFAADVVAATRHRGGGAGRAAARRAAGRGAATRRRRRRDHGRRRSACGGGR